MQMTIQYNVLREDVLLALNYSWKQAVYICIGKYDSVWIFLSIQPECIIACNDYACVNTRPWLNSVIWKLYRASFILGTRGPGMHHTLVLLSRNLPLGGRGTKDSKYWQNCMSNAAWKVWGDRCGCVEEEITALHRFQRDSVSMLLQPCSYFCLFFMCLGLRSFFAFLIRTPVGGFKAHPKVRMTPTRNS